MLLKGKPVADKIKEDIAKVIEERGIAGKSAPKIALLRAGERPDDVAYEETIIKNCREAGILSEVTVLEDTVSMREFMAALNDLNADPEVHGILIFRPLPQELDEAKISRAIKPEKDIDCMSPVNMAKVFTGDKNAVAPCTAEAVHEILKHYYPNIEGKKAVIVNRSLVLGKPLSMLLLSENATVTVCHSKTKDLKDITSRADVVVTGIGKGRFFGSEYFSKNCIVVDAGINFLEGELCGDVDFDSVAKKVKAVTPVPGGLGMVTSMVLLRNVVKGMLLQEG